MTERTEEQKLGQESISVVLGGKSYDIRPLAIRRSGEWRRKSMPLIGFLMSYSRLAKGEGPETSEAMEQATIELFTTKTDAILESFFEYGHDLPRDEIEESATDGEIIVAFLEVFNVFVAPLSVTAPLPPRATVTPQSGQLSSSS